MAPVVIRDESSSCWLEFSASEILESRRPEDVLPILERVAAANKRGLWAAGFLAYEAASALDPVLTSQPPASHGPPLIWWLIGPAPQRLERPAILQASSLPSAWDDAEWHPKWQSEEHGRAVAEIHRLIAAGDTYQVNLTFPLEARQPASASAADLFRSLWQAQKAPYSAFLETEDWAVCSASPELFFSQNSDRVVSRPMKGTSRRGRFVAEDALRLSELSSEKNQAENLMVTDMIRNDLGRLARPGSVQVDPLFAAETYPTVHQLVSQVVAETKAEPVDVLRTLFPCASITGAPKKRATEIISRLEARARGLYTGAIGFLAPNRRAQFSVAIRTASLDKKAGWARYGVGGGIVWDSEASAEYDECRAKALVLASFRPSFELLETLQWNPTRSFVRLAGHLDRLAGSANYFGFSFSRDAAVEQLREAAQSFEAVRHRVRLRLGQDGELTVDASPWPFTDRRSWRVVIDDRPVDANDPLLFHKTTHRRIYRQALERWPGADEVLLWNQEERLTEGTRTNVVLRFGKEFLTPRLAEGLLPGVYRQALLARGRLREAELPLAALHEADDLLLINSLRGLIRGELVAPGS